MALPPRARIFVTSVIGAGMLVLIVSTYVLLAGAAGAGWLVLAALGLVTGTWMIKLPRIETRFSLSDVLVFTSVLLISPACAVIVAAVDALAASLRFNKRDQLVVSRTMFNMAAAAISIWVPGQAFLAVGGRAVGQDGLLDPREIAVPLAVLVMGYSLLNTGAVAAVVALSTRTRIAAVWRENFSWVWVTHAWSGLVAGAIATRMPYVNTFSTVVFVIVGLIGYATVRVYVKQVEASTGHLQKLNELYLATIKALAMAIDAKDQVTHGHIRRVQVYALGLARALGVEDEATLKGIEASALLHDTGKIAIPEHILNKPGKLTSHEYERMKAHVTIGADILGGIGFPYPVIPYVRHHHENWNGTGYPDKLKGEEIPLGARILAVADCYDALTSDRPYRRALSTEDALAILRSRSGTMYDPAVVAKFIEIHPQLMAALSAEHLDVGISATAAGGDPGGPENPARPPGENTASPAAAAADLENDLHDLPQLGALGLAPEEVAFAVINRLRRRLRFTTAAVYAPRVADDRLEPLHVSGRHADLYRHSTIRLSEGLSGWVAAHGQFIVNADPTLDLLGPVVRCEVQLASALVVPFTGVTGARGALALYAESPNAFTLEHAQLATTAAVHLSRALRTTRSSRHRGRFGVA